MNNEREKGDGIRETRQEGKWYQDRRGGMCPHYEKAIIEIVGKIHSEKILGRIYKFVLYLYVTYESGS